MPMEINLEIKYSIVAETSESFFGALKIGQNKKSYIFWEIGIQEINVKLFEKFQKLIPLQV